MLTFDSAGQGPLFLFTRMPPAAGPHQPVGINNTSCVVIIAILLYPHSCP